MNKEEIKQIVKEVLSEELDEIAEELIPKLITIRQVIQNRYQLNSSVPDCNIA